MGCCGQKRAEASRSAAIKTAALAQPFAEKRAPAGNGRAPVEHLWFGSQAATPNGGAGTASGVEIRYLERSPVRVRGPVTAAIYEFSPAAPIQRVDARDAEALVATRFFRRP